MEELKRISNQYLDGEVTTTEFWNMFFHQVYERTNEVDKAAIALLITDVLK